MDIDGFVEECVAANQETDAQAAVNAVPAVAISSIRLAANGTRKRSRKHDRRGGFWPFSEVGVI